MGEYFREPHNKIQAGFALHAGKLLNQYDSLSKYRQENYEPTLLICALQSLVTICQELIKAMKKNRSELWFTPVHDVPLLLGVSRRFVTKDTFEPCELTYGRFIEHLRNALSHPTSPEKKPYHSSTGFTTLPDNSGIISRFLFIDSPWVVRGEICGRASSPNEQKVKEFASAFEEKRTQMGLRIERNSQGRYEIRKDADIFVPIFEVEMPVSSLRTLAIELANYLAQATMEGWDGKTIHRLVA
jgi:hypothetical protein